jgi:hypothetical protein
VAGIIAGSVPIKRSSRRRNGLVADSDRVASVGLEGMESISGHGVLHSSHDQGDRLPRGRLDAARELLDGRQRIVR